MKLAAPGYIIFSLNLTKLLFSLYILFSQKYFDFNLRLYVFKLRRKRYYSSSTIIYKKE